MNKKAFTLIELMVVLLLMGIVYSLYFYSMVKSKKPMKFTLDNMRQYMKKASKQYKSDSLKLIYNFDEKVIYLVEKENKILEKIDFEEDFTQYLLKKDDILEVKGYKNIDLDGDFFEPKMVYKTLKKDTFTNLILNMPNNTWRYYNSFFGKDYITFDDETKLIRYIKKTDYLPMSAGKNQ